MKRCLILAFLLPLAMSRVGSLSSAPFPGENGEALLQQAVVQASSSIVRIETIGGLDIVEGELAGTGPTTGVIVASDGYIITSAYNFVANPASILVTLPDSDRRLPAEIVARDHHKQLTLLKVEATDLIPAVPVPMESVRVGQWAIAVGRTYAPKLPNVSLGLVSALERVNGKAIQTDAKVSPANYGGPLIDLQGRVLGILAPLSPQGKGLTDGMNWYDSGIGFAVPLEEILQRLEAMREGRDLHPGLLGISFSGDAAFLAKPIVQEVRPTSPAATAGLKSKDRILRVQGRATPSVAAVKQVLGRYYAGDVVELVLLREDQEVSTQVTLAEKLEPFHFGWLGIQLSREQSNTSGGVVIEYLFPDSSAEKAGLVKRDRLLEIDGRVVESAATLRDILLHRQSGQELPLKIAREGESREITVSLLPLPEAIPAELPLPIFREKDANQPPVETGEVPLQLEGQARICRLFIPEEYNPRDAHGCVMWLSGSGEPIPAPQFAEWKRLCRMRGIILLMPVAENLQPWSADDTAWLIECLNETRKRYTVDTERVCLVTAGQNPGYAWQLALEHREHFKGILALSVPDRIRLPMNEPGLRFQVLLADHSERGQKIVPRLSELLRKEGFPVARVEFEQELQSTDFDAMGRWLEILGSH
ncbi:MAG: PDZ domain-containing protein [Planctomycetaceae bacterium]|nr:PDZ domain-containing protein [Planctomycetaceae bacterium]